VPERIGNSHFVHVPYNTYPTRDGHIIIACIGDAFFERFLSVIDHPELRRPEYLRQPGRYADKARIDSIIGGELRRESSAYWLERLRQARIPCGPVNDFAHALQEPQVVARDMVVEVPLRTGETVRMPGNPVKLSATGTTGYTPPPAVGEHTEAVLRDWLGYDAARLEALRAAGAVA